MLAHEYGHHVQDILGTMSAMKTFTGSQERLGTAGAPGRLLRGDLGEVRHPGTGCQRSAVHPRPDPGRHQPALDAAQAVGDDRIQERSEGRVNPEQWTHGSSAQRQHWFTVGMQRGTISACDTFGTDNLDG